MDNKQLEINRKAPVFATATIEVAAQPGLLWDLLADIDHWPDWNPDVKTASLQESLASGSNFSWKTRSETIISTLARVERPRLLAWTGKLPGVLATHFWHFELHGSQTLVRTEEAWEGLLPRLFHKQSQKIVEQSLTTWLDYLNKEAQRRAQVK